MKVFSLFGLTCTIFSCVLHGAPSDSLTERSVIRLLPGYSIGTRSPFSLAPQESFAGTSGLFRFDRTTDFHASVDQPDQNESLVESPFYFRPAFLVGGALATTAVLIRTDQQTYNTLHSWRMANDPLEDVSPVITNLGDGRASMAIFGGFLAYSYVARDRSAFQAGKIGLESFLVSGIVTQILKHTFGRERPSNATQNGGRWNGTFLLLNQGPGKRGGYASFDAFPSGHTATVFAAATTLAEVYSNSSWVSYASYSVATSVAISRVMERAHWLSDCFVGGIIGYFSTKLVLHYNHMDKPIALFPTYESGHMALALNVGL